MGTPREKTNARAHYDEGLGAQCDTDAGVAVLLAVVLALVIAQLIVPRRLVFIPLFVAVCHVPDVGSVLLPSFTAVRLVMLTLLARVLLDIRQPRREWQAIDGWVLAWSAVLIATGFFHGPEDGNPVITRLGMAFDVGGVYLCTRKYIREPADVVQLGGQLAIAIVPLAITMAYEKATGQNAYEFLGATFTMIRQGHNRAAGAFDNAILAGTVGAIALPLVLIQANQHRVRAVAGLLACLTIVYSSASSGPLITLGFAVLAVASWPFRKHLGIFRAAFLLIVLMLHLIMNDPVWYLMARIDITGGSVGFHRAELITQALKHFGDWWIFGTDYTRDWIPYGVPWSENHADITNYYIKMAVLGGLPLTVTLLGLLTAAFRTLAREIARHRLQNQRAEFTLWCVGVSLAAYCLAFIGVAPYDQSASFIFILLGAITGVTANSRVTSALVVLHRPSTRHRSPGRRYVGAWTSPRNRTNH
jgi:hypothetical protein